MTKTVNILGLYRADVKNHGIEKPEDLSGEVWSLTDWYRSYPWLPKIDRLYDLHGLDVTIEYAKRHEEHDRFPGDWKAKYESCGAKVIVDDPAWIEYLNADVEEIDRERLFSKPLMLTSTVDIMVSEAVDLGFKKINLYGLFMIGTHDTCIPGLIQAIDYARGMGVEVYARYEKEWREYDGPARVINYIAVCRGDIPV